MDQKELTKIIDEHSYLQKIAQDTILTTDEDFDLINDGYKIDIDHKKVSVEVLKRILNDEKYYQYAKKFFDNEIKLFRIKYIFSGDVCGNISYNKITIIEGIRYLLENNMLTLNPSQKEKYDYLCKKVSFPLFVEKNINEIFDISIDNIDYSIPIIDMISFMELDDQEYDRLIASDDIKTINYIPKIHFIYATYMYFCKYRIINNYLVSSTINKRYKELESLQKIDFEALNRYLEIEDSKYKEAFLNDSLVANIKDGLPNNVSPLEQAIYIYIKMCKILTYDDEYYVFNQEGSIAKKHQNINYITGISPDNNKVVCFEFNLIFSKFLSELGLKFSSDYLGMIGEIYGHGHVKLTFRSGKYLINADSVTSILHGDLVQAKLNQPLVGLKCLNCNKNTVKEFEKMVTNMYSLIVEQEKDFSKSSQVEHIEDIEEIVREYIEVTTNIKEVSLNERLSILIDKVNSLNLVGIDSLSYALQLRKILFTQNERDNNIAVTVIKNNEPMEKDKYAEANAIFTINTEGFTVDKQNNNYFYFRPNQELIPISRQNLQDMFDFGNLEYIDRYNPTIPGIKEAKGMRR